MEIINKKIEELKPYDKNPRKNDEAVDYVAKSIQEFGFKVPIIIDKNGVIVTGHTRLKAAKKLGMKEVPTIIADDLTEEQVKAFRLADNKVSEFAEWDFNLLDDELSDIINIDMDDFGFNIIEDIENTDGTSILTNEKYTTKVDIPQYEIKGENPSISELCNKNKTEQLIENIKNANIDKETKEFLISAAQRHLVFDYAKIAEFYAHASKEVQQLMEESALIIIDYDDAIKYGYMHLRSEIEDFEDDNYEE